MILEVKKLTKSFIQNDKKLEVHKDLSFSVNEGEFICVLGPSGCGKSTLLKEIAGFESIDTGSITLNGYEVSKPEINRIMVFQDFDQLFPWKTVLQNVVFPLKVSKIGNSKKERENIAKEYLTLVKLENFCEYYPHQLSGGMKQRVALIRALVIKPKILLMDEPFGSLDALAREELQHILLSVHKSFNVTIIFVTHDIDEAILLSNRIIVMEKNPNNIKKIINNDIPFPREENLQEIFNMHEEIYNLIKE
ncbi:MAG: ABC transporter ATP-binding protein [Clostridium sp.]|uniref:ABC transporter ATP-binding protein n=1 Tax=Clostridium sp. TaxID=1506 RepID=UPI003D6D66E1